MIHRKIVAHGFLVVALVCFCGVACRSERPADTSAGFSPQAKPSSAPPANERAAITWAEIASSYDRLSDYVCVYDKEERAISKGELQTMRLSFRKPFDVRLEWLDDKGKVDQTAVYRQGQNNGKVLARQSGLLGSLAGKLQLDPNDPLALSDSRHPITEIGFGKIIERFQRDASNPGISSRMEGEEVLDGRPVYKFSFTANDNQGLNGLAAAHQGFIWIDQELKLPAKIELYDAGNALLERHRFKNIRINQKLNDKTFSL